MSTTKPEQTRLLPISGSGTYRAESTIFRDAPHTYTHSLAEAVEREHIWTPDEFHASIQRGLDDVKAGRVARRDDFFEES